MSLSSFFRLSSPLRAPLAASLKTLCSWPNSGHFSSSLPLSAPLPSSLSFSSSSPSSRNEPEWWETLQHKDYEWLRSPVAQTGQFLRLPYLGPGSQPKGIMEADFCTRESDHSQYLPFFYSSTRQELHQRLLGFRHSWKSGSKAHIAPAGPQGVGKSLYSYMICCFAAVHGFPLLYIPLAGQWCTAESSVEMNYFLLQRFAEMNSHLKMEDPILEDVKKLAATPLRYFTAKEKNLINPTVTDLLTKFNTGFEGMDQKIPRFIVVDEHNELFRPNDDGSIPATAKSLKRFARWGLGGVAVMCGSSHSKFFALMPSGTKHTILELPPLSKEDAVAFLTDPESPAFIAGLTTAQAERLFGDLGGVPRILTAVKEQIATLMAAFQQQNPEESQSAILNQAVEALLDRKEQTALRPHIEMEDRFIRFVSDLDANQKQKFVAAAEHCLLFGHFPRPTWSQPILDHGLIFTKGSQAYPVNQYASTLLMDAYLSFVQKKRLSSIDDEAERGHELERQIFAGLRSEGSRLVYQPLVKQKQEKDEEISIGDHRYQGFDGKDFSQLQPLPRLPNGEVPYGTWLFRPLEKTFPRVDFVIVSHGINCKKVIAIQSTVSEPNVHAAGPQSDWKGFFGVAAAAGQNSSAVTWTQLCKQLAINIDQWFCDYIYITTSEEPKGIADDKLAQLPAGTSIGVMKRKHLSSLKIVY